MFKNKYTARPEDHYLYGNPKTNRDPPNTGYNRPPKSCNKTCYNKSKSMFEKTTTKILSLFIFSQLIFNFKFL